MKFLLSIAFYLTLSSVVAQVFVPTTATDFSFVLDKMDSKLSDYRGQVVYLSFWASWCKPCINNFHKYAQIRSQLNDMGVVLLNVNIDKNEDDYVKALAKYSINGINGFAGADSELMETYQLYSIPAYEIVQKDGSFYYLSDDPDRNILSEFQSLVDQ